MLRILGVCKKNKKDTYEFVYTKAENVKQWKDGQSQVLTIQKSTVVKDPDYKVYFANSTNIGLQQKLMSKSTFKDNCRMWRGEEIGKNCNFIMDSSCAGGFPLITGSEAKRYQVVESSKWILEEHVEKDIQDYKTDKILIRQVGSCINATINLNQGVTTQSVYSLYPTNREHQKHLFAIVGILNSKLFDFFYRLVSGDKQLFKRIILENIKALPFPNMKSPIIERIDLFARNMYQTDFTDTEDVEKTIDFYTYKLYNLLYDEVLVIDPETPITREEYENFKLD